MRLAFTTLIAVLSASTAVSAQTRPADALPRPMTERVAPNGIQGCALSTDDGLTLVFQACPAPPDAGAARELEVVEYRNGDAPIRAVRVTVDGVVHRDLAARRLSWSDPDDDGDGIPTAVEARRAGGRMKVGRVTLRRTNLAGPDGTNPPWIDEDADGDGFPVAIEIQDRSGAVTILRFRGCGVGSSMARDAAEVTLACADVRPVPALDANPYARLIARATGRAPGNLSLEVRRTPPAAAASRSPATDRALRLRGAALEGWYVDLDPAAGTSRWTLEIRPDRIDMP